MKRTTGEFSIVNFDKETVRAFVPYPLPPIPPIKSCTQIDKLLAAAHQGCSLLNLATELIPDQNWFIYGFVRKEALLSSQIEGTQASLTDLFESETNESKEHSPDIEEVTNYVNALNYALKQLSNPKGLPISIRLIKEAHKILMQGARGSSKAPGEIRKTQNWIGGTRPGNAKFVPPPPDKVMTCFADLEKFINSDSSLDPIIRAGLIHVQFETIHPFLDGNGRIGRLLVTLLLKEWNVLNTPLLYLSLFFKRHQQTYYDKLLAVRDSGDWEGWIEFFLEGITTISEEAVATARELFLVIKEARELLIQDQMATIIALKIFDLLPKRPILSIQDAADLTKSTRPAAAKAVNLLCKLKIISEMTGKQRGMKFIFSKYVSILARETEP